MEMKNVFPKRLKSARLLAGLSQDKLVERMNGLISKNAISKYEKGVMLPDSKVLLALSKALNVKPDYFFRTYSISIDHIEFRKKSKLGIKKINSIKEEVMDIIQRYLELEQFLDIETEFHNPLSAIKISSSSDVEQAVSELLQKWKLGLNALPNVIELLEDQEIKVIEIDTPEAFDGFSGWADKKYPLIVLNSAYGLERKRLTALHELGHLLLNFSPNLDQKEIERLCFQFAGAMLIPEETVYHELGKRRTSISLNELIHIKETYGISIQAIMRRAKDLSVINENYYRSFCIKMSKRRNEEGMGLYKGEEKSKRFQHLLYRAAAEEIISLSKAANLANQKLAAFRRDFIAI